MKPPSGGPMTGPIKAGIETQAMASISARLSTERISTRQPTGVIIAPPIPCTMRATTKSVSEEDAAQPIEPSTNTTIAARNTVRPPNRSAVQPLIGMNTASESRYEVTASLSANGLVLISAAIAGNDVAITVESRFSMNKATGGHPHDLPPRRTVAAARAPAQHILLIVPSLHAIIAVHMKREDRRHRAIVDAIERHGPPPGYSR